MKTVLLALTLLLSASAIHAAAPVLAAPALRKDLDPLRAKLAQAAKLAERKRLLADYRNKLKQDLDASRSRKGTDKGSDEAVSLAVLSTVVELAHFERLRADKSGAPEAEACAEAETRLKRASRPINEDPADAPAAELEPETQEVLGLLELACRRG